MLWLNHAVQQRCKSCREEWTEHIKLSEPLAKYLHRTCTFWTTSRAVSGFFQDRRGVSSGLPDRGARDSGLSRARIAATGRRRQPLSKTLMRVLHSKRGQVVADAFQYLVGKLWVVHGARQSQRPNDR
jgi:hypothetical protein